MIALEKVTKSYDGKVAVDAIDLAVPAGSVFGLIGPNGAGKTTTLKMIATLIKPDAGRITVLGLDLGREARAARRILGYMPDQFGTFRSVSCVEYLEFFGRAHGLRGADLGHRVGAVLELTDLGAVRDEAAAALSTGMRQRLCLAKTLLHDPRVLVLDEPASGLDPRARIEIRSLLKELGRMGKTVIVSSHILADLEEICSDVAIIERGKVVWGGSLAEARKELRAQRLEVAVEVPEEDLVRAAELVRGLELVERAEVVDGKIVAKLRGPDGNRLLEALIGAGIEILGVSQERASLEAIFLERTKGVVS
ncbi:MAG: ABC transporter ATP-binding protein [Planctomycetes bacterium]|nr:ABC transporter ATP-binding protein [Planctomycetota bacterium]